MNSILIAFGIVFVGIQGGASDKIGAAFQGKIRTALPGPGDRIDKDARSRSRILRSSIYNGQGFISEDGTYFGSSSGRFDLYHITTSKKVAEQDIFKFRAPGNNLNHLRLVSVSQETYVPNMRDAPLTFGRAHVVWSDRKILVLASPGPELLSGSIQGNRNVLFVGLADLQARGNHPNREKTFRLQGSEVITQIVVDSYARDSVLLRIGRHRDRQTPDRIEAYHLDLRTFNLTRTSNSKFKYPDDDSLFRNFSGASFKWKLLDRKWQTFRQGPREVSTEPYILAAVSKNRRFALVVHQDTLDAWVLEARR